VLPAVATVVSVLALLAAPASVASAQNDLSSSERARLRRGELVTRPATRRVGGQVTFGGTSYQLIRAPLAEVWRAVSDPQRYTDMLPQVRSARQVGRNGESRAVALRHQRGPIDVRYVMNFLFQRGSHTILFNLDETRHHDIRAGWGFIRLAASGADQTLVSFGAMMGIDSGVVSAGMRPTLQEWLLKVPLTMKWYIDRQRRAA
jgi:carbon monoxide dehydrogenase subunit G